MNSFFVESTRNFLENQMRLDIEPAPDVNSTHDWEKQFFELINYAANKLERRREDLLLNVGEYMAQQIMEKMGVKKNTDLFKLLLKGEIARKTQAYPTEGLDNLSVRTIKISENRVEVIYRSERNIPDFAVGSIIGTAKWCNQPLIRCEHSPLADGSHLIICEIP